MAVIPDISFPADLKPETRRFPGVDDQFVNADGIIAVMKRINTPQAKTVYRHFRKRLVETVNAHPDLPAVKQRERAILAAIEDAGWRLNIQPAPGGAA